MKKFNKDKFYDVFANLVLGIIIVVLFLLLCVAIVVGALNLLWTHPLLTIFLAVLIVLVAIAFTEAYEEVD